MKLPFTGFTHVSLSESDPHKVKQTPYKHGFNYINEPSQLIIMSS